jgi:hypothetical protein
MIPHKNDSSKNSLSLNSDQKYIEFGIEDPSYQILDLLDNTLAGYLVGYDGAYSEGQDIPKQELRRLTSILKQMEKDLTIVRSEFERRLTIGSR